jgi:PKD repeat protein
VHGREFQLRDFGTYRTMVTAHTVDVGGGRAGIRWYELRESDGTWGLWQEGTFGPDDGEYRWLPSAAMNAAGDIGIGYALSSANTYVSTMAAGQSAANSGSGLLDAGETLCAAGSGVQVGTNRSGDYSATSINPTNDSFWHTNEVFTDPGGSWRWNTYVCEFTVGAGNIPPTASFTISCTDLTCNFTDTSTNGDGTVNAWDWDFGDGGTSNEQDPSHSFAWNGTYTVTLTVTDDGGATGTDTQDVTVSGGNTPPTASFTHSCTDLDCSFDGSGSSDSDGTVDAWSWDFGDGNTGIGETANHPFATSGTYTVTLTVTDDGGATDATSQSVTVTEPSTGITLTAIGYKVKGRHKTDLTWTGATSAKVDVYRDGELVTTIPNTGSYTDNIDRRGGGSYIYQVCEEGTSTCSNTATVVF